MRVDPNSIPTVARPDRMMSAALPDSDSRFTRALLGVAANGSVGGSGGARGQRGGRLTSVERVGRCGRPPRRPRSAAPGQLAAIRSPNPYTFCSTPVSTAGSARDRSKAVAIDPVESCRFETQAHIHVTCARVAEGERRALMAASRRMGCGHVGDRRIEGQARSPWDSSL
jgi:hypothetical protein